MRLRRSCKLLNLKKLHEEGRLSIHLDTGILQRGAIDSSSSSSSRYCISGRFDLYGDSYVCVPSFNVLLR